MSTEAQILALFTYVCIVELYYTMLLIVYVSNCSIRTEYISWQPTVYDKGVPTKPAYFYDMYIDA